MQYMQKRAADQAMSVSPFAAGAGDRPLSLAVRRAAICYTEPRNVSHI